MTDSHPRLPSAGDHPASGRPWRPRLFDDQPGWSAHALHMTLVAIYVVLSASIVKRAILDDWFGRDAKIYLRAAAGWLAGSDPWGAGVLAPSGQFYHYAGLPPTMLAYAPLTRLPEWLAVGVVLAVGAISAVYVVRRLGLPPMWLLFPPVVEGLISGNPSLPILALLVSAAWPLRALAPVLKVYALAPLIGERDWRAVTWAGCFLVVTGIFLFPLWTRYVADFWAVSARLFAEAGGGYSGASVPVFFLVGAIGLVCIAVTRDWRAIGWLVIPALWPSTQFHYSTLALPVMAPILAVGLAFPVNGLPPVTIGIYGVWSLIRLAFLHRRDDPVAERTVMWGKERR